MRIGMVCPYDWNVPGGVRSHIQGLSEALMGEGHTVEVLTPASDPTALPAWAASGGRPVNVSYNGSVAGLSFGLRATRRVRGWIRDGQFDVVHIHEPLAPSLSVLSCWSAKGPIVGTWHSSLDRSRIISAGYALAQTAMEKLRARIAVSEEARRTLMSHVGGDAVLIPNGVRIADFQAPAEVRTGNTMLFLGRMDESRKGLSVLLDAMPEIVAAWPEVNLVLAGPGDPTELVSDVDEHTRSRITVLGMLSEQEKREAFWGADLYIAPQTGGESFGIVLIEAMAAGATVVASDLPAFRSVLDQGECGALFRRGDSADLAATVLAVAQDPARQARMRATGSARAKEYDWDRIVDQVVAVYDSVRVPGETVKEDLTGQLVGRIRDWRPR